jgi:hypothetical protein
MISTAKVVCQPSRIKTEGWYAGKGFGAHRRQRVQQVGPTSFIARMPYVVERPARRSWKTKGVTIRRGTATHWSAQCQRLC